jgi:hypothetical protein
MTREWKRQEKHGHSSFFFFTEPSPPRPLFLPSFSFFLPAPRRTWHVEARRARTHTHSPLFCPRRPPLDGNCSRDRAFRTQSTTVKDSRLASIARKWMRQQANLVSRLVTTRRLARFETYYTCVFMPVISRTTNSYVLAVSARLVSIGFTPTRACVIDA